jgi:hypothetical protein
MMDAFQQKRVSLLNGANKLSCQHGASTDAVRRERQTVLLALLESV